MSMFQHSTNQIMFRKTNTTLVSTDLSPRMGGISQDASYYWLIDGNTIQVFDKSESIDYLHDFNVRKYQQITSQSKITYCKEISNLIGDVSCLFVSFGKNWILFEPYQRRTISMGRTPANIISVHSTSRDHRVILLVLENGIVTTHKEQTIFTLGKTVVKSWYNEHFGCIALIQEDKTISLVSIDEGKVTFSTKGKDLAFVANQDVHTDDTTEDVDLGRMIFVNDRGFLSSVVISRNETISTGQIEVSKITSNDWIFHSVCQDALLIIDKDGSCQLLRVDTVDGIEKKGHFKIQDFDLSKSLSIQNTSQSLQFYSLSSTSLDEYKCKPTYPVDDHYFDNLLENNLLETVLLDKNSFDPHHLKTWIEKQFDLLKVNSRVTLDLSNRVSSLDRVYSHLTNGASPIAITNFVLYLKCKEIIETYDLSEKIHILLGRLSQNKGSIIIEMILSLKPPFRVEYPPRGINELIELFKLDSFYASLICYYCFIDIGLGEEFLKPYCNRFNITKPWQLLMLGFHRLDNRLSDYEEIQYLFVLAPKHPWENELEKRKTVTQSLGQKIYASRESHDRKAVFEKIVKQSLGDSRLELFAFPFDQQEDDWVSALVPTPDYHLSRCRYKQAIHLDNKTDKKMNLEKRLSSLSHFQGYSHGEHVTKPMVEDVIQIKSKRVNHNVVDPLIEVRKTLVSKLQTE